MKLLDDPCAKIRFRALLQPPWCMEKGSTNSTNLGTAAQLESSEFHGTKSPKRRDDIRRLLTTMVITMQSCISSLD